MKPVTRILLGLSLPAAIFAIWWFATLNSTSTYWPPLSSSAQAFVDTWFFDRFTSDLLPTVIWILAGCAIGCVAGLVLGVALGLWPRFRNAALPMTEFARAVPTAGLVPLALVLLGPGFWMYTVLGGLAVFFQVVLSTMDGVRSVDSLYIDVSRSYGLSRRQRLLRVILPSATPQIMAGVRIGISIGIAAVVIANLLQASEGVGYVLREAQSFFDIETMWAAMFMIGLLGFVLNGVFLAFEHRVLAWHRGWRGTQTTTAGG